MGGDNHPGPAKMIDVIHPDDRNVAAAAVGIGPMGVGSRPKAGVQRRKQDFQLPAIELGAYWMLEPVSK